MFRLRRTVHSLLAAIPLLLAAQSASAIKLVGPGCPYTKIQAAINDVLVEEKNGNTDPFIGVTGNIVYNEALVIDGSNVSPAYIDPFGQQEAFVQIYGDYAANCADAEVPNTVATVSAGGIKAGNSALEIRGSKPVRVVLNHFVLTAASGVASGGGINVHPSAAAYLDLTNVDITGNNASFGGGIYVGGHAPGHTLALHDHTTIQNNTATNDGGGILANGETFLYATEGFFVVFNNTAGGAGGGISFRAHGSMTLGGSTQIVGNHAGSGGGIYVNADRPTDITFNDGVFIAVNNADQDGGGVSISGPARLLAQSTSVPTQIFNNQVLSDSGSGGGVALHGPARMWFTGSIFGNSAGYGGGISARTGSNNGEDVTVNLLAANAQSPVSVSNNSASHSGGGVYLKPFIGFSSDVFVYALLCAQDFLLNGNNAVEGTAISADRDQNIFSESLGSQVLLNYNGNPAIGVDSCPAVPSASRCADGLACSQVSDNVMTNGSVSDGSTIFINSAGELRVRRTILQNNRGAHVVRADEDGGADLRTVLVTDNTVTGELIRAADGFPGVDIPALSIADGTLAHNSIGAQFVLRATQKVTLLNTIVAEDVVKTFDFGGNDNASDRNINFVLANPVDTTLQPNGTVLLGKPTFVSVANRNYRLAPHSLGLDVAPVFNSLDLDGNPHNVDVPQIPNVLGPHDLGAYELQSIPQCSALDQIFCNGFGATGGQ